MTSLQQLYDATLKLELAQQEIEIIKLEKIEYEKEINQLKQQNEELLQENNSYIEDEKLQKQHMLLLHCSATNTNDINSYNLILNKEIFKYKKLVKSLTLQNAKLQKENAKYRTRLEQLNKQKQKRKTTYMNNELQLQNTIKQLQNQCNTLQNEINALNVSQIQYEKCRISSIDSVDKELLSPLRMPSVQKAMCSLTLNHLRMLSIEAMYSENMYTQIMSNGEECIECDKCEQYRNAIPTKIEEKIDEIIDTAKRHINKLMKRVKFLQQQNEQLMLQINHINK
eukprot:458902_1